MVRTPRAASEGGIVTSRRRQVAAVLAAAGLVLTAVSMGLVPSPVGEAAAAPLFPTCGIYSFVTGVPCPSSSVTDHVAEVQVSGNATTDDSIVTVMSSVGRPEQGGENYAELKPALGTAVSSATVRADSQNPVLTVRLKQQNGQVVTSKTLKEIGSSISIGGLTVTFADLYKKSSTKTVDGTDDTQTALDIYSAASAAAQSWDEFNTVAQNYLSDTRTVAFAKAQAAAIEAIDAGKTEAEVRQAAVDAVRDYYTKRQLNYYRAAETKLVTLKNLALRAQNESGVSGTLVELDEVASGSTYPYSFIETTQNRSLTLINGTSASFTAVIAERSGNYRSIFGVRWSSSTSLSTKEPIKPLTDDKTFDVQVDGVDTETSFVAFDLDEAEAYARDLKNASNQIEANAEKWVNGTYSNFTSGNLNATEYINPLTLAQEYATQYNQSGYFAYAAASLASIGYEIPDLNQTGSMVVAYNGSTYTGLLASQNTPPNGTWEAGRTYDADLIQGVQVLLTQSSGQIELDGTFQILEIQTVNGTQINSTTSQTYSYQTINNTQYLNLQEQLTELRKELESREPPAAGGGGGGLIGGGGGQAIGLGLLAGGVFAYLYTRKEDGM